MTTKMTEELPPVLGNLSLLDAEVARMKEVELSHEKMLGPIRTLPDTIERMREKCPTQTEESVALWEWANTILPNLKGSQLPARFHYEVAKWEQPKQLAAFTQCRELCQGRGAIVVLVGERGMGKTTIAAQLILERAKDESRAPWARRPPYRKLTDLIASFKLIYADYGGINSDQVMEQRDGFCKLHPLVIIDELHECDDQKLKDRILTDIIDRRYSNLNDTILITNQTPQEFKSTTNDSILSRLTERGRIIQCVWPSFRQAAA